MTLRYTTLPEIRRRRFKDLLETKKCLKILEAHSGLSGLIANNTRIETSIGLKEFDGTWHSSLTDSAVRAHPDAEIIGFDRRLQAMQDVLFVTDKPMIMDGDTGGDGTHFEYVCTKLEQSGVSAVIIEDKKFPKRNSLEPGARQDLEDVGVFCDKIRRGKQVVRAKDFYIIARLESLIANRGVDDALHRAEQYLLAGADGVMVHAKEREPKELLELIMRYRELEERLGVKKILVAVPTAYNHITDTELSRKGVNVIIHANHMLRSSHKAMQQVAEMILANDRSLEVDSHCTPVRSIFHEVGFLDVKDKDKQYAKQRMPGIILSAGKPDASIVQIQDTPIAELDVEGKSMLQRQVETLNNAGIADVHAVVGYKSDTVSYEHVKKIENPGYASTHILSSLMCAKEKMNEGFVFSYGDILYSEDIVERLLSAHGDIVLVIDGSYREFPLPDEKVELVQLSHDRSKYKRFLNMKYNHVKLVGTNIHEQGTHEFIGLAKFSQTGAQALRDVYEDCLREDKKPFHQSKDLTQATFVDLLQEMIDRGYQVSVLEVKGGWMEVRCKEDLELARSLVGQQIEPKVSVN